MNSHYRFRKNIGKQLSVTQKAYDEALGQLSTGNGNAISQALKLKSLGLKSDKKISDKLLPPNFHEGVGDAD